jgi:exopolyphosphatase / guanosine-5'-triphosphate,3'-diphosphate pyrophosphatase
VRRAAIDLGSNSVLLTVVDESGQVLHDEARVVGLGKDLGDGGVFLEARMGAAAAALADYAARAETLGVPAAEVAAVATSAARRASNASAFFDRVRAQTGLCMQTISGEEEARLSWLGATSGLSTPDEPLLVIDIGGGSTEVIVGRGPTMDARRSLEAGSVRLTEGFLGTGKVAAKDVARARDHVAALVSTLAWPVRPTRAIAVAGTATTLAAIDAGLMAWNGDVVHGHVLSRGTLATQAATLQAASPAKRRVLAQVSPPRADFLLAGTVLLDAVLAAARLDACTVSIRGLRFGLLS